MSTTETGATGPTEGPLSEGRIPEILRELYVHRRSGRLHFRREGEHRTVVFRIGCIVDGAISGPGGGLGDVMVYDGLLTADELARTESGVARTQQPFGVVLEKLGLIERGRLQDVLALYVREVLLAVFCWEEGTFRFEERAVDDTTAPVMPSLSTGEIILDAVRLMRSAGAIRQMLGDLGRVPVGATDPLLRFQRIPLTRTDGYVLSRVDGSLTARQIIDQAPAPADEVERSLLGLYCTGMIELIPPPAERPTAGSSALRQTVLAAIARLQTRNHYEVLGVPPTASPAELRAAYVRQARLFHPDSQHDPALVDLREQIEKVFARLNEAYETLSYPSRRADYEGSGTPQEAPPNSPEPATTPIIAMGAPPPPTAGPSSPAADDSPGESTQSPEQVLSDATRMFDEGRYWEVLGLTQNALPHAQGLTRQRLHVVRGKAFLRHPDYRKQAIQELNAALAEDAGDAQVHFLLGVAYGQEGLKKRALGHLRRALELRPQYRDAQREIDRLGSAAAL